MAKPKKQPSGAIVNRRAKFDYTLGDTLTVGIVLSGPEVRAARDNKVSLKGSYVNIRGGELWLNNASFSVILNHPGEPGARSVETESKKLLAKRSDIDMLQSKKQPGLSIVPLKLINKGRFIKLVIALGKGKKNYDKRETIKRRDQEREVQRKF